MRIQPYLLVTVFWVITLCAQAQPQPTKPLPPSIIEKAFDEAPVGGQVTLTFQYKGYEITGDIITTEQQKKKDEARRQALLPLLQKNPEDFKLNFEMYELARDTAQINLYKRKCYAIVEARLKETPIDPEAYFDKGHLLQIDFKYQDAFAEYGNYIRYRSDSAKVFHKAGELFFFYAQYGQAKAYFEEALKRDLGALNTHLFFSMADLFESMSEISQAESRGQSIEQVAQKVEQYVRNLDKAIIKYPERQDFKDFKLYNRILWLFYKGFSVGASTASGNDSDFNSKDFKASSLFKLDEKELAELKELEKGLQQIISQKKIANTALAHEALGLIAVLQNNETKALQYFEKVIKLNPEKTQNHYNILFIYLTKKDYKKAEATIKRKMAYSKELIDYQTLATIYERQKKYDKAKEFCKEGINAYPLEKNTANMANIKLFLGTMEANTKNYAEAEKYLQEALALKENNEEVLYKLALAQLAQEKWVDGYSNLSKANYQKSKEARKLLEEYFDFKE